MLFLIAAVVFGLVFTVSGVRILLGARRFLEGSVRTEGTIVDLREERFSPGARRGGVFYPRLRFQAHDGREIETEAEVGLSYPPARPDQPVTILYNPGDPHRARLSTTGGRGYTTGLMFLVGGLALIAGFFFLTFAQ